MAEAVERSDVAHLLDRRVTSLSGGGIEFVVLPSWSLEAADRSPAKYPRRALCCSAHVRLLGRQVVPMRRHAHDEDEPPITG